MAANRIKRIIQFSAGFNPGDAISNEMLMLKSYFQEIGFLGEIYSENIGKDTNGLAKKYNSYNEKEFDFIIYHHSIHSAVLEFIEKLNSPKALIYHNVTPSHFFEPYDLKLTVITNSFPVAVLIEDLPNVELIFAGGKMCKTSFATGSIETIDFFRNFRADVCILGVCSIHHERGITGIIYDDSQIKKNMIQNSNSVIALSSIEKIGTAEAYFVCPIKDINILVTNISPEDEPLKPYKDAGIIIV